MIQEGQSHHTGGTTRVKGKKRKVNVSCVPRWDTELEVDSEYLPVAGGFRVVQSAYKPIHEDAARRYCST